MTSFAYPGWNNDCLWSNTCVIIMGFGLRPQSTFKKCANLWNQNHKYTGSLQACWSNFLHANKEPFHTHLYPLHRMPHRSQRDSCKGTYHVREKEDFRGWQNQQIHSICHMFNLLLLGCRNAVALSGIPRYFSKLIWFIWLINWSDPQLRIWYYFGFALLQIISQLSIPISVWARVAYFG